MLKCCAKRPGKGGAVIGLNLPKFKLPGGGTRASAGDGVETVTVVISRAAGSLGIGLNDDNIVTKVTPKSSSETAGVKFGDKVISVDGKEVGKRKLVSMLAENPNTELTLELARQPVQPTPGQPGSSASGDSPKPKGIAKTGSYAAPGQMVFTFRLARDGDTPLGVELSPEGTEVKSVLLDTVAAKVGLAVGDVVTKVDGTDIVDGDATVSSLRYKLSTAAVVTLTVRRGVSYDTEMVKAKSTVVAPEVSAML